MILQLSPPHGTVTAAADQGHGMNLLVSKFLPQAPSRLIPGSTGANFSSFPLIDFS